MNIGIVIPTLDEETEIGGVLASVASLGTDGIDVAVSDGGSSDRTLVLVTGRARVVHAARGRARQLNEGSRSVGGDALLFLHADCRLPAGAFDAIRQALAVPGTVGGAFHKRFDSRNRLLRRTRLRTALWHRLGYVFGDQAIFVRREAFERLGGFREDVRAEDMDLAWRMRALGKVALLAPEVVVSARRLEQAGVLATWIAWWRIGLREAIRAALEGSRSGDLSSEPRSFRGSSGSG